MRVYKMNIRWAQTISTDIIDVETDNLFYYEPKYKILICREHQYAVRNLRDHLRDKHARISIEKRRVIIERYTAHELRDPAEIELPAPLGPPIPELGKPVKAVQCGEKGCSFVCINRRWMQQHCRQTHGWKYTAADPRHWHAVCAQTFFTSGGFRRYFTVQTRESRSDSVDNDGGSGDDDNNDSSSGGNDDNSNLDQLARTSLSRTDADDDAAVIKHKWAEMRKNYQQELEIADGKIARTDRTGWFNRTGWPEHLAGRNLRHLAHASRLPDRNERELKRACDIVDQTVEQSVAGLASLAHETRRWLKSAKREEIDVRPIARLQNPESQARYSGYMKRFVCYCLRIVAAAESISGQQDRSQSFSGNTVVNGNDDSQEDDSDDTGEEEEEDNNDNPLHDAQKLFRWHGDQHRFAREMWQSLVADDDESDKALVLRMLDLLGSFIFHTVSNDLFRSPLIHFLAVLGIDRKMSRLRTADNYSYILAGVVYCVRVLGVELLLPSSRRKFQGEAEREYFLQQRRKFLADGSYSPMSTMINLLAYSKHITLNKSNEGSMQWSADHAILYFQGRPLVISRFCQMIQDAITEAEQLLWGELMWVVEGKDERFAVALDRMVDDMTFTKRGVSFVSRPGNGLRDGLGWMIRQMQRSEKGGRMRRDGAWQARLVRRYLRTVDRFREMLLFCVHVSAGQPARGTEITTIRYQNGFLQDRNVYVMDGMVAIVTRYHKSQSQYDTPKIVPRFLPQRVGQLMVVYLGYVRPFAEHLEIEVARGSGFSDHVWAGNKGPWETDRLTSIIAEQTALRLGERLTTLDYRHVAISLGRVFVGEQFAAGYREEIGEAEEAEVDVDVDVDASDPLELQAGRGERIGERRYGVSSDIVKHLSIRSMATFRRLSEKWHQFLGLSSSSSGRQERQRSQTQKRPFDRVQESDRVQDWQLKCRSSSSSGETLSTLPPPAARQGGANTAEIRTAMQKVLGQENVSFRSPEQELALKAVLDGQTPLVVILPTGGGKSLLFMVPSCLSDAGVTIVVTPLRSLTKNMVSRMKKAGIDCLEWRYGETNTAAVVVVSADMAASWSFLGYASLQQQKSHLRRVVIDECHLTFTASDYRPKLARLRQLRALGCQMVLLTATLPPLLECELGESMLVHFARYIRAVTVRPNIRYTVQQCRGGTLLEAAVEMCRRQERRLSSSLSLLSGAAAGAAGWKGMIYCRSKEQCEMVAEELGCGYYHAEVVDQDEKIQTWLSSGGWIAATTALGSGVDFPGIVLVVHVGMPYGMIDYAQESGRAGRGGETADSVVLVEDGEVQRRAEQEEQTVDKSAMAAFIETSDCRRGVMSLYLDGKETVCRDGNGDGDGDGKMALCDRCGEGVVEWQSSQAQAALEWRKVRMVLNGLTDGCAACWVTQDQDSAYLHGWEEEGCLAVAELSRQMCEEFGKQIIWKLDGHSCMRCGVSQEFCATGVDVDQQCQWPNVVVPMVRAAMGSGEAGMSILKEVGYMERERDWRAYARWLGRRHPRRVWGKRMSNAMVVVIKIILYILDGVDLGEEI